MEHALKDSAKSGRFAGFLARFPFSIQIAILASFGIIGLITVGIYVFVSTQSLLHYVEVEQEKAHELVLIKDFDAEFTGAISEGKDFMVTGKAAHLEKRNALMAKARKELAELGKLGLSAEEKVDLEKINTAFARFDAQFRVVADHVKAQGLTKTTMAEIEGLNAINGEIQPLVAHMSMLLEKQAKEAARNAEAAGHSAEVTTAIIAFSIVLLVMIMTFVMGRSISRPLFQLADAITSLTKGETEIAIAGADRKDEIGTLWRAVSTLRDGVEENFRIKQMVDKMPINVMTLDKKDFTINYVNETSLNTLRQVEHLLPCKADEILGKCVDIFHKHPEHQRSLLANPDNLPHEANIKLGEETLKLEVSAVRDKDGVYIGPMVAWSVITDQVKIASRVREVVDSVAASSTEMKSTAESMASTAEETNSQAAAVAAASEQATNNVQTVASAAEELSASINEIGEQVSQSTIIAQKAVDETQKTNETVQGLAEAAQKIGDVVNLINDIAAQTNLLALNATIEAARAGDAGKGFAVVASEVKSLANQTAQATEEIAGQINAMQSATQDAVGAIGGITTTIEQINEIAGGISAAVEEQGAATQEIARNVQEASQGTKDVSENITGVTLAAQETGKASEDLLTASGELARQGNELKAEIESFMQKIGAA
jgi:methyl-accepting chemotaxis protein